MVDGTLQTVHAIQPTPARCYKASHHHGRSAKNAAQLEATRRKSPNSPAPIKEKTDTLKS